MTTSSRRALRIFISHANEDNDFGKDVVRDLRAVFGKDAVWYDSRGGLHGGDQWWDEIRKEIASRNVFIVVLSPDAVNSQWVNDEINIAWKRKNSGGMRIIPLLYRESEIRDDLDTLQVISFLPPETYKKGLKKLLKALELIEGQTPGVAPPPLYSFEHIISPAVLDKPPPVVKSLPLAGLTPRSPEPQKVLNFEPESINDISTLQKGGFYVWLSAFCLVVGASISVGIMTQSWGWSITASLATAVGSYLLYFRKGKVSYAAGMFVIVVASCVLTIMLLKYVVPAHYDVAQTSMLSFFGQKMLWYGRQLTFGLIVGISCAVLVLFFSGIDDDIEETPSQIGGSILLALIAWAIIGIPASFFGWGFGYGAGWWLSIMMVAAGIVDGIGATTLFGLVFNDLAYRMSW